MASVYEVMGRMRQCGFLEMTSGLSPYSALSLVQLWIHALRQSTRLLKFLTFSCSGGLWCLRIQRSAWFDIGYMQCVSLRGF